MSTLDPREKVALKLVEGIQQHAAEAHARYKIEIQFDKGRTRLGPNVAVIMLWESGKQLHGGGDQLLFWCGNRQCQRAVSAECIEGIWGVCPHCKVRQFMNVDDRRAAFRAPHELKLSAQELEQIPVLDTKKYFKLQTRKVASWCAKLWRELDCSADIYLKFHPSDIRYSALHDEGRSIDILERARTTRLPSVYPLRNILRDTASGADLAKRFFAFLTA